MSIREAMNRHPRVTTGVVIPVILLALGGIAYYQMPEKPRKLQTRMFFTVDDGKTWFADDATKVAPFDKDGQEAVVAHVYGCGRQEPFVAYLERIAPEAMKRIEEIRKAGVGPHNAPELGMLQGTGIQRKRPGDGQWVKMTEDNAAFEAMAKVSCKDGKAAVEITPEIP